MRRANAVRLLGVILGILVLSLAALPAWANPADDDSLPKGVTPKPAPAAMPSGKLQPGAFDSFPNGSCIEAGICGVAVFITDKLGQNMMLKDREDIVIVPYDVMQISEIIDDYLNRYDDLCALGKQGSVTFQRVFGSEAQIEPRLRILQSAINAHG